MVRFTWLSAAIREDPTRNSLLRSRVTTNGRPSAGSARFALSIVMGSLSGSAWRVIVARWQSPYGRGRSDHARHGRKGLKSRAHVAERYTASMRCTTRVLRLAR